MALKIVQSAYAYDKYLKENNSKGICFGMVVEWIVNLMSDKAHHVGPPRPYTSKGQARHDAYTQFFDGQKSCNSDHKHFRKVIQDELGLPVKAKKTKKYLFGSVITNNDAKRLLLRVPKMNGTNVGCSLIWRFGSGGHAVAVFKNKASGEIYFYDPNFGVYEWQDTGVDLYHEIKIHLKNCFKQNIWLQNVAITEKEKDINVNSPHIVC